MPVRASVAIGLVGTALAVVLVGSLHVLYSGDVDPVRRTISEYALRDLGWMFDTGVLALAAGSVAVLIALVRAGLVRWPSFAAVGMLVWAAGMVAVVVFEKTNWAVGPSVGGVIHRYASVVGFLSLPLAVLLVARRAFPDSPGWRLAARGFAGLALGVLSLLFFGVLRMAAGGGPWWLFVPLGLVERAMALFAVAAIAVVMLGLTWAKSEDAVPVAA